MAHSLGGLVVANALSRQHGADEAGRALVDATRGIIFLGISFERSDKAEWGHMALRVVDWLGLGSTKSEDIEALKE